MVYEGSGGHVAKIATEATLVKELTVRICCPMSLLSGGHL